MKPALTIDQQIKFLLFKNLIIQDLEYEFNTDEKYKHILDKFEKGIKLFESAMFEKQQVLI